MIYSTGSDSLRPRTCAKNESVLSCSYISSVVALALGVAEAMLQTRSWPKDRDEMERTVLEAPGLVVVDFTANWCISLGPRAFVRFSLVAVWLRPTRLASRSPPSPNARVRGFRRLTRAPCAAQVHAVSRDSARARDPRRLAPRRAVRDGRPEPGGPRGPPRARRRARKRARIAR